MTILTISGSLRARSSNTELLRAAQLVADPSWGFDHYDRLASLPPFNPDLDFEGAAPPEPVRDLRARIAAADALLISSPEYAHGVPGSLKNALDWMVSDAAMIGKPIALLNASQRSTFAHPQLAETLRTMSTALIAGASLTVPLDGRRLDAAGIAADASLAATIRQALDALRNNLRQVSSLFSPLTFRTGLTARNRVVLAPMTNKQSHADGSLGDDELRWLCSRAEGGFGVVMTCAAHVAKDGQGWPGELGIFDDALLPGLTTLATALRERGAVSMVQIFHGGLRADPAVSGAMPWSASAADGIREATPDDLARVVEQFAAAAQRAKLAGFDGVELHGAHGYLFTQFLSAEQNRRTDAWGGPLQNRARLLRDALRAVRASVGASFTVGVRLSPENFGNAKGLDLDESVQTARWLAQDGADFVHLSLWRALEPTAKRPSEHALPVFRAALPPEVAILAAGALWTRAEAEQVLALGADAVALGRSAIVNRDWPLRARQDAWQPRRPPVTLNELREEGLSEAFAGYMRTWKGFVQEV